MFFLCYLALRNTVNQTDILNKDEDEDGRTGRELIIVG